jgi:hypothetical protein
MGKYVFQLAGAAHEQSGSTATSDTIEKEASEAHNSTTAILLLPVQIAVKGSLFRVEVTPSKA